MGKVFRPNSRESKILSRIESSKGYARRKGIESARDHVEPLSNAIAMKLVESSLVETTNKNVLEEQISQCIKNLSYGEDFDIDYKIAPFRHIIPNPNVVSLYVTAFVIENLINHKVVVDVFGSDEEIYLCINRQVVKFLA